MVGSVHDATFGLVVESAVVRVLLVAMVLLVVVAAAFVVVVVVDELGADSDPPTAVTQLGFTGIQLQAAVAAVEFARLTADRRVGRGLLVALVLVEVRRDTSSAIAAAALVVLVANVFESGA